MSGWFNPNTPASNRWRPGRKFKFGKHKGLKVYQVMRIDPAYILWASEAIPLDFSKNIIEDCQKAAGSKKGKYHNTNKKGGK